MQWLIDLVIEAIGVPPCFYDRGDPPGFDYGTGTITQDGFWHTIDLSAIVGVGAVAVLLRVRLSDNLTNQLILLRKDGNTNEANAGSVRTQVANINNDGDVIIPLSSDYKIQYKTSSTVFTSINFVVKGWWK